MTTTAAATPDARPLVTRSRAELERAVIEAARVYRVARFRGVGALEYRDFERLDVAVADLDEWEKLREEVAG
ncbi:MAG TPA: hypothetical protein VNM48_02340 [Chloroflexota bacterium]|nr:hypothetical protein [Chloroflexota bacterium]